MSQYKKERWNVVPEYVVFVEQYPDDFILREEYHQMREREFKRWETKEGLFHCSFCGQWKKADEVDRGIGTLNFFVCNDRKKCDACLAFHDHPESFMERGWYPESLSRK